MSDRFQTSRILRFRTIVVSVFMLSVLVGEVTAQTFIAPYAGVEWSKLASDDNSRYGYFSVINDRRYQTGTVGIGFQIRHQLSSDLFISVTELLSFKQLSIEIDGAVSTYEDIHFIKLNSSVLLNYLLTDKLYVGSGLGLNYVPTIKRPENTANDFGDHVDLGIPLSIGYNFNQFLFEIGYYQVIWTLGNNPYEIGSRSYFKPISSYRITVAYLFELKFKKGSVHCPGE